MTALQTRLPSPGPTSGAPVTVDSRVATNQEPLHLGETIPDTVTFTLPSSQNLETPEAYSLPTAKAPALQRPVLLIHGYNSGPATWQNMDSWLTKNGQNVEGGVVEANSSSINGKGRVFEMQFSSPTDSVKTNCAELTAAINKISAATGGGQIDLVGHSMGGLDARAYLDQGGDKVKNLVMIATPNRGSELSDIELNMRKLGVPILPTTDNSEIRQCLQDLTVDTVVDGKPNNPTVHALNQNWDRQRAHANVFLIAGNGTPTLETPTLLTVKGDGVVPRSSVQLDNVPLKNFWGKVHTSIKDSPDVLQATANFLTGKAVSLDDVDPPNAAPDRQIVPVQISVDANHLQYIVQDKNATK